MLGPTFRWRCAALLVIAEYQNVHLIPRDLRALPLEPFTKSWKFINFF
jgi:hypothetical protein